MAAVSEKKEEKKNKSARTAGKEKPLSGKSGASRKGKSVDSQKKGSSELVYRVLLEPWITEKTHQMVEESQYVFRVFSAANKFQIKQAIEELYGVTVEKVQTVTIPSKTRYFGRKSGKKSGFKKAVIRLKAGDKIELFEGV